MTWAFFEVLWKKKNIAQRFSDWVAIETHRNLKYGIQFHNKMNLI